ncbi:MAG: YIP1 family protein [Rhodobacteraceae bacterium]|nr:YIP1 family protein [Paracoccaceae bacterium]
MTVSADILESYAAPGRVMRRKLAEGPREDRALATLMAALGLIFLGQWPGLIRATRLDPAVPFDARVGGALMGLLFLAPLIAYGLAGLVRLVARMLGGQGTWFTARLALFWSLLAASPLMLVQGLVAGLIGPGPVLSGLGLIVLVAFLWLFGGALRASEAEGAIA